MRFIICVAARTQAMLKHHFGLTIGQLISRKCADIGLLFFFATVASCNFCYMVFLDFGCLMSTLNHLSKITF